VRVGDGRERCRYRFVSVDGGPLSAVDALRDVPATHVREVRYLSASDAAQRFGVRAYSGPVILVTQK
jgi:hypothetical protein